MATMTKKRADARARWLDSMDRIGISREDAETLRRIEMTLHRWAERECNGEVEVGDDGKAWRCSHVYNDHRAPTANREAGALRRLAKLMARYPDLRAYHQTDPRGCALYVYELSALANYQKRTEWNDASMDVASIDWVYSSIGVAVGY